MRTSRSAPLLARASLIFCVTLIGPLLGTGSALAAAPHEPGAAFVSAGDQQSLTFHKGRLAYNGDLTRTPRFAPHIAWAASKAKSVTSAVRQSLADGLIRLGAPSRMIEGQLAGAGDQPESPGPLWYEPAGDLDRDGGSDFLGYRYTYDGSDNSETLTTYGVRGRDGRILWTYDSRNELGFSYAFPLDVGPDAAAGALVISYDFSFDQILDDFQVSLQLTALSGTGKVLWQETESGDILDVAGVVVLGTDLPAATGLFQATGNASTDTLIGLEDFTYYPDLDEFSSSVEADVLDGSSGGTASRSTMDAVNREPFPTPGPDLSGDGLDDYVFVSATDFEGGELSARRGVDGQEIWHRDPAPVSYYSFLMDVGDVTGDGREDMLSWSFDFFFFEPDSAKTRAASSGDGEGFSSLILLSGADGTTVWEENGDFAQPLGDIDGDGAAEVLISTGYYADGTLGLRYRAVDGQDTDVYSTQYAADAPSNDFWDGFIDVYLDLGDVEPDGIADNGHQVVVADFDTETFSSDRGLVSGRTGDKIRSGRFGFPLWGSVDGHGADVATLATVDGSTVRITPQDGLTGAPLWVADVSVPVGSYTGAYAFDVSGDGHDEVVLLADQYDDETGTFTEQTTVLSGIDGAALWSRAATGE